MITHDTPTTSKDPYYIAKKRFYESHSPDNRLRYKFSVRYPTNEELDQYIAKLERWLKFAKELRESRNGTAS